jgi:sigma-B regulation protein RsbU (phosphoserine phosphatase)
MVRFIDDDYKRVVDRVLQLHEDLRGARSQIERYSESLFAVQHAILPQEIPEVPGLDLAVYFSEAGGVGGDFGNVQPAGPGRWSIAMCDVSGHGLAAAAILGMVHALGTGINGQKLPPSAGAALALINNPLATRYLANTGRFVTAFAGRYDAEAQVLTYALAGHPPPRLVREQVHRLVGISGLPLGLDETSAYEETSVRLLPGDRLILFTDGITENMNAAHESFGDDRLDELLRAPVSRAADLLSRIVGALQMFRGGTPGIDDESCLVALVKPIRT